MIRWMRAAIAAAALGLFIAGGLGCSDDAERLLSDLKSDNPVVRLAAAIQSRAQDDPRLVDALVLTSADGNATIRARSIESMGIIGDKRAVPTLIKALKDDDREVRREAVEALGKLKDQAAVKPLLALVQTEEKPYDVVWALGQLGARDAIPVLTPMLQSTDKYLAYNATMALRRIR